MKIAYFGFPAIGHTTPILNLIKQLVNIGNEVTCYNRIDFKILIEQTGAKFVDYQSNNLINTCIPGTSISSLSVTDFYKGLHSILVSCAVEILDKLLSSPINYDIVIYDQFALWGQIFADKFQLLSICSCPMFLDSADKLTEEFCVCIATDNDYFEKISSIDSFVDSETSPKVLFEYLTCKKSDFIVVHTSRSLQPEAEEKWFEEKYLYLGNRFDTEIFPSNADFYHDAKIYISLGTIFNGDQNLIIQLIDYFRKNKGYKVVFSTGGNDYIAAKLKELNLPSNITISRYVDQHNELTNTALFISHSGLNSIYESLYFTVPLILIPQMTEHAVNAKRAEELGVGYFIRNNNSFVEELALAMEDMHKNWRLYKDNTIKLRNSFLKSDDSLSIAKKICYIAQNSDAKHL